MILSGGPSSIYDKDAPIADLRILDLKVPVLGICYGMQYLTHVLGGVVARAEEREYGNAGIRIKDLRRPLPRFQQREGGDGLDEPRRPHREDARRLQIAGRQQEQPCRRHGRSFP